MNAALLIFVFIAVIAVILFLRFAKNTGGNGELPYRMSDYFLTKAERSFYGVLAQAVGSDHLVFAKVRVADVLATKKGMNSSDRQRAFNAISAKHFDFLICDPGNCSVKLAIELFELSLVLLKVPRLTFNSSEFFECNL